MSEQEHDGKLDTYDEAEVCIDNGTPIIGPRVCIAQEYNGETWTIELSPQQAISLLTWLMQKREMLEQMVKESDAIYQATEQGNYDKARELMNKRTRQSQ